MAITEITKPSSPGLDPGRYDSRSSDETQPIPVILLELQDRLSRSRVREAFWLSVMFHLFAIIAVSTMPHWVPGYRVKPFIAMDVFKNQQQTFLALPSDLEKVTEKPKTDVLSDKDRIATTRHPELNRKDLQKILDANRPGPPGPPEQQMASASPPAQAAMPPGMQPNQGAQQQGAGGPPAPPSNQQAKLESLPPGSNTRSSANNPFAGMMSAGSSIQEAARATAPGKGGGAGGDYGTFQRSNANVQSGMEILSDTQGVDFGPYLSRVHFMIDRSWHLVMPESVFPPLSKKGIVTIEFAIQQNGRIAGIRLVSSSGDVPLDRAAWGGITGSDPFPPLPTRFTGPYLALRCRFFYNPSRNDME